MIWHLQLLTRSSTLNHICILQLLHKIYIDFYVNYMHDFNANFMWFIRLQSCDYVHIDRWIGLVLPANVADCGCADPSSSECAACRSSWTWLDGSSISEHRFTGNEPGRGERCGRMEQSGSWAGAPNCNRTFKAICKKGTYSSFFLLKQFLIRIIFILFFFYLSCMHV